MGKPDVPTVPTFECRSVLDSIQNEFDQLQKEDSFLSKLHQDLADLIAQRRILAKQKGFNDKYCVLCCSAFNLLFKRKILCHNCQFLICRSCSAYDYSSKQWICNVCDKQKLLNSTSRDWICNRIRTNFKNFSAAKALQSFCRLRRISDSENDSGYGAACDLPLMKLLSSHSLNKVLKMADVSSHDGECEEDEDEVGDEEELAEIQYSIETILEGLLGGTLEDALVDQIYPNSSIYLNIFATYHVKLVEVIQNLSKALQKALHNLPTENGNTPTTAHSALKSVIMQLVDECQDIPLLQFEEPKDIDTNASLPFNFSDIFSTYDSLVASAVINKVIEESQSKFKKYELTSIDGNFKPMQTESASNDELNRLEDTGVYNIISSDASPFGLPVACVQIEEIEEITREFTDSEDDKLSSISKWSNSLQSIDEVGLQKQSDSEFFIDMDQPNDKPTPFPEFGRDLVDPDLMTELADETCHPTSVTSWEENWLFRKKKRLPLYSNLKYQLLTYCDEPPSMLIPCPSECTDATEQDEFSSELSETHSAGSLEFSSDSEELNADLQNLTSDLKPALSKSEKQNFVHSSPVSVKNEEDYKSENVPARVESSFRPLQDNSLVASDLKYSERLKTPEHNYPTSYLNLPLEASVNLNIENSQPKEKISKKNTSIPHHTLQKMNNHRKTDSEKKEDENLDFIIGSPPRPGTIAEREHQKWLNAVPLKNNPYSAENIHKRSKLSSKNFAKDNSSTYEEFERKHSVTSETSDCGSKKVNCGPKLIDTELYKRDYYVNQEEGDELCDLHPVWNSSRYLGNLVDDCFDPEALNSFEEKIYVKTGKVFTLEDRVKRLEREINDPSLSPDISRASTPVSQEHRKVQLKSNSNGKISASSPPLVEDDTYLPSVKSIASKLKPVPLQISPSNKPIPASRKIDEEKFKKGRPCRKIHSLTARSLSREFREIAKQNHPKPMNRTIQVPTNNNYEEGIQDDITSPVSVQSPFSPVSQHDNGHGYTSDESNTSSTSVSRPSRSRRHISRSILERATYWERRAEQGLLSDASVNEEFPGVDI